MLKAAYSRGEDEFSRAEELLAVMKASRIGDSLHSIILELHKAKSINIEVFGRDDIALSSRETS